MILSGCSNPSTDQEVDVRQTTRAEVQTSSGSPETIRSEATSGISETTAPEAETIDVAEVIDRQMATMSIEEKVGQLFFLDLQTYETTGIPAGGLIFFKHDLPSWEGTIALIETYQGSAKMPLFMGVDEEGGIVTRITGEGSIGGRPVDNAWSLSHGLSELSVEEASQTIVDDLSALGFNMNFAPVADINSNPDNPIIGKRAFSDTPELTATYVVEALGPYKGSGIIPVVKHFPGHGNTQGDSHLEAVYVEGDLQALQAKELMPFQAAVNDGVEVVMMGHIKLPQAVENQAPASLNQEVIQGMLRDGMGFKGLVISDSLIMASITNHYSPTQVVTLGLEAGLDMFLMPEAPEEAFNYLVAQTSEDGDVATLVDAAVKRILTLKYSQGL